MNQYIIIPMLITVTLSLFITAGLSAQDTAESIDQQLQVVRNDGGNGGEFHVAMQVKATAPPDASTLGSATIDINYDAAVLSFIENGDWTFGEDEGYQRYADQNEDGTGSFVRLSVFGIGVNENSGGISVGDEYDTWVVLRFEILDQNALANLDIRPGSNSIGLFENSRNEPDNGVIFEQPLSEPETIQNNSLVPRSVTLIASPEGGGTLDGAGTYGENHIVTVMATPNAGYSFLNWTEGETVVSEDPEYTFTMQDSDVTLTANFELIEYQLTTEVFPEGSGSTTGDGMHTFGEEVPLTAIPNTGWQFDEWRDTNVDTLVSTEPNFDYIMPDDNVSLTAHFSQIDYTLTVLANPADGGEVTGGGSYNFGDIVPLTATPNTGWQFDEWRDTDADTLVSTEPNFDYIMPDDDVSLTAHFTAIGYILTVQSEPAEGGEVTGGGSYNFGDSVPLTAAPNAGWQFVEWRDTDTDTLVSSEPDFEYVMPAEDVSLTAHFQQVFVLTLIANPTEGGIVADNTDEGPYTEGTIVNVTAAPGPGWLFVNWTQDGIEVSDQETFDFTMPAEDVTLVANFETVVVNIAVYLGGAFDGDTGFMRTNLNTNGLIPTEQPYSGSPWNYEVPESVPEGFFAENTTIVDWVLIELRTGTGGATTVGTRAAFVTNNGNVVDLDGESPVRFEDLNHGEYYIVVRHRNHIAIMSADPVPLNFNSDQYDFREAPEQAFGMNPMRELNNGLYAMYGGDGNADGQVTSPDFNLFLPASRAGETGYHQADYTLEGQITSPDFNIFLPNSRQAAATNVPD